MKRMCRLRSCTTANCRAEPSAASIAANVNDNCMFPLFGAGAATANDRSIRRRTPVPRPGRSRRDRHEPQSLRPCRQVADARSRHCLRRRQHARRRSDHARSGVHRGARPRPGRHRAHARPRGSSGRGRRSLAAAAGAGLCHAVRRVGAAPQARAGRPGRRGADHRDSIARQVRARAVRTGNDHDDAFDPRAECAGGADPARHRVPYRRLEDRSRAAAGRRHRRGDPEAHRRRRRARHGLRQHQRLRRRRGGVGVQGAQEICASS